MKLLEMISQLQAIYDEYRHDGEVEITYKEYSQSIRYKIIKPISKNKADYWEFTKECNVEIVVD